MKLFKYFLVIIIKQPLMFLVIMKLILHCTRIVLVDESNVNQLMNEDGSREQEEEKKNNCLDVLVLLIYHVIKL